MFTVQYVLPAATQSRLSLKKQFWPVFVKDIGNLVMILVLILCREAAAGEDEAQQLTIFYGGKVVVFDKFPPARVKDLLQIVNAGGDGGDRAGSSAAPQASRNSLSGNSSSSRSSALARRQYLDS